MPIAPSNTGPISTFYVQWWYTPKTKLGFYFNGFNLNQANQLFSTPITNGLDGNNGMGASIQENYHYENIITNHPVENTKAISDHIIPMPNLITIQGIITSIKPILFPSASPSSLINNLLGGGINFTQLGNATKLLIDMAQTNTGLTLQSGLLYGQTYQQYNNLAVQSLDIPRSNEYGKSSIRFTIVFKELILTTLNSTLTQTQNSNAVPSANAIFNYQTIDELLSLGHLLGATPP